MADQQDLATIKQSVTAWNDMLSKRVENVDLNDKYRADLSDEDLSGMDLTGSDFRRVNLRNTNFTNARLGDGTLLRDADFTGANFYNADFSGAKLAEVYFTGASLCKANLRETDLRNADLSCTVGGLKSEQLAGADVTGAKLPEALTKLYEKLGSVSEISDSAKKLFLGLLTACVYSWLTIGTTKDVDLITNRASSPLPIIQTAIPIAGFYVIAPAILLCIYFYFHFYLQKLWDELASLPAILPDGRPLHQRADPWLFNDLVRSHFTKLKPARRFLSHFQKWLSILLAWWLVPITLLFFWGRYLRRHDLPWTYLHASLLAISIAFAIQLYRLAKETLHGVPPTPLAWKAFRRWQTYTDILRPTIIAIVLIFVSRSAITGPSRVTTVMGWARYSPFATLQDVDVSIKPPDWTGKKDDELNLVKGADLKAHNLSFANAQGAFLVKAQLANSHLEYADFRFADLRKADFTNNEIEVSKTHSENARFDKANLSGANLAGADLRNTTFLGANLTGANLASADLRHAELAGADLTRASLAEADLSDAKLIRSVTFRSGERVITGRSIATVKYALFFGTKGLTPEKVRDWDYWYMALYDIEMLQQLGLPIYNNQIVIGYRNAKTEEPFESWKSKWYQQAQAEYRKSGAREPFDHWASTLHLLQSNAAQPK